MQGMDSDDAARIHLDFLPIREDSQTRATDRHRGRRVDPEKLQNRLRKVGPLGRHEDHSQPSTGERNARTDSMDPSGEDASVPRLVPVG